ncbi:hypothetical protein Bbelb_132740 [Branchiostoma belcheri]|nr:hypothetical protein Bbelb_132740 [Branchiostoma belcheri]
MACSQIGAALQYPTWTSRHRCLGRKVLNRDLWVKLKDKKTSLTDFTINDVVQSGVEVPSSRVGVYAGDEECYRLYSNVFEPIIKEYHGIDEIPAHVSNLNPRCLASVFLNEKPILSTRCRVVRNLSGYGYVCYVFSENVGKECRLRTSLARHSRGCTRCKSVVCTPSLAVSGCVHRFRTEVVLTTHGCPAFAHVFARRQHAEARFPSGISRENRLEVESVLMTVLDDLEDDLGGKYYPYESLTSPEKDKLDSDKYQTAAGISRHWPEGRGIFYNKAKTFLVWVNEEDHLRIISMQKGADVQQVFNRLCRGINAIHKGLLRHAQTGFAFDKQYGYLSSCPTNLGTGMRASVHVTVPSSLSDVQLKNTCRQLGLDVRGRHGETSEAKGGVFDLSNRQRLGRTEVELLQTLVDGINSLYNTSAHL